MVPVAAAAVMVPFRHSFVGTAAALVLVGLVCLFAVALGRGCGYAATLSSTLAFDFFLTRPYERLAITHRGDLETAISLLVVGVAVTELAAWGARHRATAQQGAAFVDDIYRMAELAATGATEAAVVAEACRRLEDVLALRACRFAVHVDPAEERAELHHDGSVSIGELDWGVDTMGLPRKALTLRVLSKGRQVGGFVLSPTPGLPVSLERRLVAVSIADQVGAAIGG